MSGGGRAGGVPPSRAPVGAGRPELLLATRSPHKADEVRRILAPLGFRIATLADVGLDPDPEEAGIEAFDTFQANAAAKARWFAARAGRPALADDSGLRVDALDGKPGVHTKRFSGRTDLSGRDLDEANNRHLLDLLRGLPDERRGARYVCAAVLAWPDGRGLACLGTVRGRITREPAGGHGFGYDPLFFVPQLNARFAEVDAVIKDRLSHRSRAFRALGARLARTPWPPGPPRRDS